MTYGKLIGIVGHLGSGKTTLTDHALTRWNSPRNCVRTGFSEPIVRMLEAMGVPEEIINDKNRWKEPLSILRGHTLRYATKTLGTEWGRNLVGDDIWTVLALDRTRKLREQGKHVIVDNCRFPSEFEALKCDGATMIALVRSDLEIDLEHESEMHIPFLQKKCALTLYNDNDFETGVDAMRRTIIEIIGM